MKIFYILFIFVLYVSIVSATINSCKIKVLDPTSTTKSIFTDSDAPCKDNTSIVGYIANTYAWVTLTSSNSATTCSEQFTELLTTQESCLTAINTTDSAEEINPTDDSDCVNINNACGSKLSCGCNKGEPCAVSSTLCSYGSCAANVSAPTDFYCQIQISHDFYCASTISTPTDPFITTGDCATETAIQSHAISFETSTNKLFYVLNMKLDQELTPPSCSAMIPGLSTPACRTLLSNSVQDITPASAQGVCAETGQGANSSCPIALDGACVDGNVCTGTQKCILVAPGTQKCSQVDLTGNWKLGFTSDFNRILTDQFFIDFAQTAECSEYTFTALQYNSQYRFFTAYHKFAPLSSACIIALQKQYDIVITEQSGIDDENCSKVCGFPSCKCFVGGTCTIYWLSDSARFCENYKECVQLTEDSAWTCAAPFVSLTWGLFFFFLLPYL